MSVILTLAEYRAACRYADPWLAGEQWGFIDPREVTNAEPGIYVLTTPCSATSRPRVCYVGKADHSIADRLGAHLNSEKAPLVRWTTVIPVVDYAPAAEVQRIEGDVARYFGVPRLCRAVPGGRGRRAVSKSTSRVKSQT